MTLENQKQNVVTRYGAGTIMIVVSFVVFFGVWLAGNRFPTAPELKGWVYPGATEEELLADSRLSSRLCSTTDDFNKVADYYSDQLGLKGTIGSMTIMSRSGPFMMSAVVSMTPERPAIQSRTFLKRTKAGIITIYISRAPADKKTQVLLSGIRLTPSTARSGAKPTSLKSWEYLGAKNNSKGKGGTLEVGNYSSSDSIETISQFYLSQFGLSEGAAVSGKIVTLTNRLGTNTLSSAPEQVVVLETGKAAEIKDTTLMKLSDDSLVLVQLSQGKDEDQTQISLSIVTK